MLYDWDSVMLSPQTDLPSKDGLPMPQADQRGGVSIVGAKRQESLERVLLRELSHRMNNELAVAIATVAVAAKRCNAEEGKEILGRLQERLESQARVHHALRMPECATTVELAAYIDDLCRAISRSRLESRGIELSLSLHSIAISAERCWLLGMIISELLTNASRHAFGEGGGSVRVELMPSAGGLECRVVDSGTSHADPVPGTGLQIIESLAAALEGTVRMRFGANGTETVVRIPRAL